MRINIIILWIVFFLCGKIPSTSYASNDDDQNQSLISNLMNNPIVSKWFGLKYALAPFVIPVDAVIQINNNNDPWEIFLTESEYAAGYVTIVATGHYIHDQFFAQSLDQFHRTIDVVGAHTPRKILLLVSEDFKKDQTRESFMNDLYLQRYSQKPEVQVIVFKDKDDLKAQLVSLPQEGQFDRIDMLAHGDPYNPGTMKVRGNEIGLNDIASLSELNLTSPGAEIRLMSCGLGMDLVHARFGSLMSIRFAQALLKDGGKVFTTALDLGLVTNDKNIRKVWKGLHLLGLAGAIRYIHLSRNLGTLPLLLVQRNSLRLTSAIEYRAPAIRGTAPDCRAAFGFITHRRQPRGR